MRNSEVLQGARDILSDKKNWTTGEMQRTVYDPKFFGLYKKKRYQYCAIGAPNAVAPTRIGVMNAVDYLHAAARDLYGFYSVVDVNDRLGWTEVLNVYDLAIRNAKAAEFAISAES
jgi:hypothetical protein